MTTRLEATVDLNLTRAQQQLAAFESDLRGLRAPITVDVDVTGENEIRDIRQEIARASGVIDVDVDTTDLTRGEQAVGSINRELREAQGELREAQARADALGDELRRTGDVGSGAFSRLRQSIGPLVATFAAGLGIREVVQQFREAINSATALSESVNAVNVVFGDGAQQVLDFGENAAESVGLARSEFQQLTVPIGALLQNFGLQGQAAASATLELTTRAADLASVMNTEVSDALLAIGSALRGEQEPIRAFGVSFDEAAVAAKGFELGLGGVTGELSVAEKGQARLALLLEQSAFAAGDFANTSDEAANATRTLAGQAEDARAALGEALLPAYEALLEAAPRLVEELVKAGPALASLAEEFVDLAIDAAGAVKPVADVLRVVADAVSRGRGDADVFGELTAGLSDFERTLLEIDRVLGVTEIFEGTFLEGAFANANTTLNTTIGILEDVAAAFEAGTSAPQAFADGFAQLNDEVPITEASLRALIQASNLSGAGLESALRGIIDTGDTLGLTAAEINAVRVALVELLGVDPSASPLGQARGRGAAAILPDLEEATVAVQAFDQALADAALDEELEAIGGISGLPLVISDFASLREAARDAGVTLTEFLNAVPENVVINVDSAVTELTTVLTDLRGAQLALEETVSGEVSIGEVEFDAEGTATNAVEVIRGIIDDQVAQADVEAQIGTLVLETGAVDVGALLTSLDTATAQAFLDVFELDQGLLDELQGALDGSLEGLATPAANAFAEALKSATVAEVTAVAVFGAENFDTPAIRQQLGEAAGVLADALEAALSLQSIAPELLIDLSNAQITGFLSQGTIPITPGLVDTPGTGGEGGGGGSRPPAGLQGQNVIITNINNATTTDVGTSGSQASQQIAATVGLLAGRPQ